MSTRVVGSNPGPWQGYPIRWWCTLHNMIGFYSERCPTCRSTV